jgi:hypothetical protein
MPWTDELLDRLAEHVPCGYHDSGPASTEPTALAAMTFIAYGRESSASQALEWLASVQAPEGSLGPTADQASPGWATSLAVLAAIGAKRMGKFDVDRAIKWILETRGEALPRTPEMGHDTTLFGWPWVEETHSWIEPTAMHVLALKAAGLRTHLRTREAVRLLIDRLLPDGGCNYGNTFVMDQVLRPHLQSTGAAMTALAGETDISGRIEKSLNYLAAELSTRTAAASLAYGIVGLAAHGILPPDSQSWLEAAYRRTIARGHAPYRLALLALAALGSASPLITLPNKVSRRTKSTAMATV